MYVYTHTVNGSEELGLKLWEKTGVVVFVCAPLHPHLRRVQARTRVPCHVENVALLDPVGLFCTKSPGK